MDNRLDLLDPSKAAPGSGTEETVAPTDPVVDDTIAMAPSTPGGKLPAAPDHDELQVVSAAHYALGAELARGGMGRIRHAHDRRLRRPVAVKELLIKDRSLAERFEREILLTARLQHPSIVSIYEAGRWASGEPFYAMRVVPGKALDAVIAPLSSLPERLALLPNVIAVVDALAYAHAERIIHRDLKPANVLIGPFGESVVIDWGLAKDLAATTSADDLATTPYRAPTDDGLTLAGSVMGTPAFMPPEQAAGKLVDERADVYALGAILYQVLAGEPPFTGKSSHELLAKVLNERPVPLASRVAGVPGDLVTIIDKAMAHRPEDRYANAGELAVDLKRFQTGQLVGAHAYSRMQLLRRWVRRHRGAVGVGALAVIALAIIGAISVRNVVRERDRAEAARTDADTQRVIAVHAKDDAVAASARLYFDQARQELVAGSPLRAAVLLRASLAGLDEPTTRLLVGLSVQPLAPLVRVFDGVKDPILRVGFSLDGASVFAISRQGEVVLWDTATGHRIARLELGMTVRDVAVSNDGATFVLVGVDSRIVLWDARTQQRREITPRNEGAYPERILGVALSPDGKLLAAVGHHLTIWEVATLAKVAQPDPMPDSMIERAQWSPGGKRLAIAGDTTALALVDTTRWTSHTIPWKTGITAMSFRGDGALLAISSRSSVGVVDLATEKVAVTYANDALEPQDSYVGVAFSPDGTDLVMSTVARHAKLIEAETGQSYQIFDDDASVLFSADGKRLLTSGAKRGKAIVQEDARRIEIAGHALGVSAAAFSPDGQLVLTGGDDGTLDLWRATADDGLHRTAISGMAESARFSPDGASMIVGSYDGTAEVLTAGAGDAVVRHTLGKKVDDSGRNFGDPLMDVAKDGRVATAIGTRTVVEIWDPVTGLVRSSFDAKTAVKRAGFVAGDTQIYAATADGLRVWDARTGAALGTFAHRIASAPDHYNDGDENALPVNHAAATVLADGRRALIPIEGGLAVIDVATSKQVGLLPVAGAVWSTIASPAGARVIVIGQRGSALFDVETASKTNLSAQGETVLDARFTQDGRSLYTHGSDATIRRWDGQTGALLVTFGTLGLGTHSFALAPDGGLLATFADDVVRLWDPRSGKLLAAHDAVLGPTATLAFSPDSRRLFAAHPGSSWTWTLPRWTGSPAELDAMLACRVPWKLVDSALLPQRPAPDCVP